MWVTYPLHASCWAERDFRGLLTGAKGCCPTTAPGVIGRATGGVLGLLLAPPGVDWLRRTLTAGHLCRGRRCVSHTKQLAGVMQITFIICILFHLEIYENNVCFQENFSIRVHLQQYWMAHVGHYGWMWTNRVGAGVGLSSSVEAGGSWVEVSVETRGTWVEVSISGATRGLPGVSSSLLLSTGLEV